MTVEILVCRMPGKGPVKDKPRNLNVSSDEMLTERARPMKGDNVLVGNIYSSESSKYMSCIKVRLPLLFSPLHEFYFNDFYFYVF